MKEKEIKSLKRKTKKWWDSLTPKEREGLKRAGMVGVGGTGIALALTYNPEALPLACLPTATYNNRGRLGKAYQKIRKVI